MKNTFYHLFLVLIFGLFSTACVNCQSPVRRMTEVDYLDNLRRMTKDGKLPAETFVAEIENAFPNTKTAALAKLLRGRIRLENGDANGAASILNDQKASQKTSLEDYFLWLRGKALAQSGNNAEALKVFENLVQNHKESLHRREILLERAKLLSLNGNLSAVSESLAELTKENDADAFIIMAQAAEKTGDTANAVTIYRRIYFLKPAEDAAKIAETKIKSANGNLPIVPQNADEALNRAEGLRLAKRFSDADKAYTEAFAAFPNLANANNKFNHGKVLAAVKKTSEAASAFSFLTISEGDRKAESLSLLAQSFANNRQWQNARQTLESLRQQFPNSPFTPKAFAAVGAIAREQKNKFEETNALRSAVQYFPNAIEVAQAQFELAWLEHDAKNYAVSSQMLTEHLARYVAKDSTYRGRAGYWAARDTERAGNNAAACVLYQAVLARYDANWYGYLANQRLAALKQNGACRQPIDLQSNATLAEAVKNLQTVTVYPEKTGEKERKRIARADDLSYIGLFDWAAEELADAAETAPNSPKINLGLARLQRLRGDNTAALLALARSYPDYAQMKPEELSREEWEIFYPLINWADIKKWAQIRGLDPYQVAGLIRQESVFNPRAKSGANAYGLMQLLLPTAQMTARKFGATSSPKSGEDLFNASLNIELGTAYMKEQLEKFGRVEYLGVAYNAGPGRVSQWRNSIATLEMDEWVEQIPFKETRGYVQGITRNRLQYQRLYDENGKFRPNVGTKPLSTASAAIPETNLPNDQREAPANSDK